MYLVAHGEFRYQYIGSLSQVDIDVLVERCNGRLFDKDKNPVVFISGCVHELFGFSHGYFRRVPFEREQRAALSLLGFVSWESLDWRWWDVDEYRYRYTMKLFPFNIVWL